MCKYVLYSILALVLFQPRPATASVVDFSHVLVTKPITVGGVLPATCQTGQLFFSISARAGQNIYGCTAPNIWSLESAPPSSSSSPSNPVLLGSNSVNVSFSGASKSVEVLSNDSVTITADRATTWSLAPGSVGSITGQSGSTVIYASPSSIQAQNAVAGCQILPNDSIFNVSIDRLPVHIKSAAWVQQTLAVASAGISFGASWGVNIVDNTLAPTAMTFHYSTLRNGRSFQIPAGNDRSRETGALATDGRNDHHLVSINRDTCHIYETYQDNLTGAPSAVGYAASGWDYQNNSYVGPSSMDGGGTTDAAGLPLLPLTLHLSEIESGLVNHALRFTNCAGCIGSAHLWPAVGSTASAIGAAPMGSRWRLRAAYNITGFSRKAQIVLTALKSYGMILSDIGAMNEIQVNYDTNQDPDIAAALQEIQAAHIDAASFDVVDESSLMDSVDSSRINSANAYVRPKGYAALIGSDASGNKLLVPLVVQPVLVSTSREWLTVQAGNSFQLVSWVTGSPNQAVTWSLTSGAGYVTSEGIYTPPNRVVTPTPFVLTATAQADTNATVTVRGNIIPGGIIRLDVGSDVPYVDASGNAWLADTLGVFTGSSKKDNSNYPPALWKNLTDWQLYSTFRYTWGDDLSYIFVVPNGKYEIGFLMAKADCVGSYDPTRQFDNGLTSGGTVGLEAQGQVTMFDVAGHNHNSCRVPVTGLLRTTVTDQVLRLAVRSTGPDGAHQIPSLNGLTITPTP